METRRERHADGHAETGQRGALVTGFGAGWDKRFLVRAHFKLAATLPSLEGQDRSSFACHDTW